MQTSEHSEESHTKKTDKESTSGTAPAAGTPPAAGSAAAKGTTTSATTRRPVVNAVGTRAFKWLLAVILVALLALLIWQRWPAIQSWWANRTASNAASTSVNKGSTAGFLPGILGSNFQFALPEGKTPQVVQTGTITGTGSSGNSGNGNANGVGNIVYNISVTNIIMQPAAPCAPLTVTAPPAQSSISATAAPAVSDGQLWDVPPDWKPTGPALCIPRDIQIDHKVTITLRPGEVQAFVIDAALADFDFRSSSNLEVLKGDSNVGFVGTPKYGQRQAYPSENPDFYYIYFRAKGNSTTVLRGMAVPPRP